MIKINCSHFLEIYHSKCICYDWEQCCFLLNSIKLVLKHHFPFFLWWSYQHSRNWIAMILWYICSFEYVGPIIMVYGYICIFCVSAIGNWCFVYLIKVINWILSLYIIKNATCTCLCGTIETTNFVVHNILDWKK